MAEHHLSFGMAQVMIDLARILAKDPVSLAKLEMRETSTAYTITHGIGYRLQQNHIAAMKKYPFSLNIDEGMSKSHKKVLAVILNYIDGKGKKNTVHLFSVEVNINNFSLCF